MAFERNKERARCKISVSAEILEKVKEVVYLRSMFNRDGRYEMDVERRIAASNMVNGALTALMRYTKLMQCWYRRCDTAAEQKKNERKMNAVEIRSLRRICGVSLAHRIRNEEVHRMADTSEDVTVRKKKKMFSWFGHVEQMSDERITKKYIIKK